MPGRRGQAPAAGAARAAAEGWSGPGGVTLWVPVPGCCARQLSGAAGVGFIEGPDLPDGLRPRTVGQDTLIVVVALGHPWARRRSGMTASELAGTALVACGDRA